MTDYYRGDQAAGITAPDLSKTVDFADHIVKARGKRTQFTSVSLDRRKIRDFGETVYQLDQPRLTTDGHGIVEHAALTNALKETAATSDKETKLKAVQALRRARRRREGLVDWHFNVAGIARKDLITWATEKVQPYFGKA